MRDRNEREQGRDAAGRGDENIGDTNLDDGAISGSTDFDESLGRPENIVGGPSAPGSSFDPTRPLAEGANDPARDDAG